MGDFEQVETDFFFEEGDNDDDPVVDVVCAVVHVAVSSLSPSTTDFFDGLFGDLVTLLFGDLFGDLLLLLRVVETFSPVDDLLGDLLRLPAADVGFFPRRFFLMSLGSISSCL